MRTPSLHLFPYFYLPTITTQWLYCRPLPIVTACFLLPLSCFFFMIVALLQWNIRGYRGKFQVFLSQFSHLYLLTKTEIMFYCCPFLSVLSQPLDPFPDERFSVCVLVDSDISYPWLFVHALLHYTVTQIYLGKCHTI